jgi:hypothetical protein
LTWNSEYSARRRHDFWKSVHGDEAGYRRAASGGFESILKDIRGDAAGRGSALRQNTRSGSGGMPLPPIFGVYLPAGMGTLQLDVTVVVRPDSRRFKDRGYCGGRCPTSSGGWPFSLVFVMSEGLDVKEYQPRARGMILFGLG